MTTKIDYAAMTRDELKDRLTLELSGGTAIDVSRFNNGENLPYIKLYHAVTEGNLEAVKAAVAEGANPRTDIDCDRYNESLLEVASRRGGEWGPPSMGEVIEFLKEKGSMTRDQKIISRNVLDALNGSPFPYRNIRTQSYESPGDDGTGDVCFEVQEDGQVSLSRIDYVSAQTTANRLKQRFAATGIAPGSPTAELVDAVKTNDLMKASKILWANIVTDHSLSSVNLVNTNASAMAKTEDGAEVRKTLIEGAFGEVSPDMQRLLAQSGNALTAKQQDALVKLVEDKIPKPTHASVPLVPPRPLPHPGVLARAATRLGFGSA